jgi:hypothetical protein
MSFHRYSLPRTAISQIRRYRIGLSLGLKIEHTVSEYPPFVVFYPADVEEFEELLDANAFPVAAQFV